VAKVKNCKVRYGASHTTMSGYDCRNKCVLSFGRNDNSDVAVVTSRGRVFQILGPAVANERSPTVTRRDGRTSRRLVDDDRRVAVVKFRMNDISGDGTSSFEVKIRTKTAKFTSMVIAGFRDSRYLVRESEVFVTGSAVALHCCKAHAKIHRKMGNSTPCKIVTPKSFILKLCTRNYVGEFSRHANFGFNRYSGGFSPDRRNITTL